MTSRTTIADDTLPVTDQLVGHINRILAIADLTGDENTRNQLYTVARAMNLTEVHACRFEQQAARMERQLDQYVRDSIVATLASRTAGNVVDLAHVRRGVPRVVEGGVG